MPYLCDPILDQVYEGALEPFNRRNDEADR